MVDVRALEFIRLYRQMLQCGKSTLDVANALGVTGDDRAKREAVTNTACELRRSLRRVCLKRARELGLDRQTTLELLNFVRKELPRVEHFARNRRKEIA